MGKIVLACPTNETSFVYDFVSTANAFEEQNGLESPPIMSTPLLHSQKSIYGYQPDITPVIWTGVFGGWR